MENKNISKEDLKIVYDNFNKAILNSDLDGALKFRTVEAKKSVEDFSKSPEDKADTLKVLSAMCPISSEVEHMDVEGNKATVYINGVFSNPEIPAETVNQSMMIYFGQEDGEWKMGTINYISGAEQIKKSPDDKFESQENYDMNATTSIGGRIVSVKFENEYTLVVVRMLDEDDLVFLPKKEELLKAGIKAEELEEWKILQVEGNKHKTNPMKILASKAEIIKVAVGEQ